MAYHKSGWLQTEIVCDIWFPHFVKHTRRTEEDPVLLILGGHASHVKSLKLIEKAREAHVHILAIPPHTSHRLQPLDELKIWQRNKPNKVIELYDIGPIFGKAYARAATLSNAENGFRSTGIYPYTPHICGEHDFAVADFTKRDEGTKTEENLDTQDSAEDSLGLAPGNDSLTELDTSTPSTSFNIPDQNLRTPTKDPPSTSVHVTPSKILPLPKVIPKQANAGVRRCVKTAIITSSPYLEELKASKSKPNKRAKQQLECVLNSKSASYDSRVDALIQIWQQVKKCHLKAHREYVVLFMDWLKRHTLNIVLNSEWSRCKDRSIEYEERLLYEVNNCGSFLSNAVGVFSLSFQKLADVIKDPWGGQFLTNLLGGKVTIDATAFDFFRIETGHLLSIRLTQLCESRCEDLAFNLVKTFVECHKLTESDSFRLNVTINQVRYCFDIYVALLFKYKKFEVIITMLRTMSLVEGLELITRFANKPLDTIKIWKHSKQIAHFVGTEYVTEIISKPPNDGENMLEVFLDIWLSVTNLTNEYYEKLFMDNIRKIIITAESAILLYIFCEIVYKKFGQKLKTFVIELYIRALTTDMNILERQRNENEANNMSETQKRLANGFLRLADVLEPHTKVSRECVLTAFSLDPTQESFNRVVELAARSGCESLGSWKCKFHPPAEPSDEVLPCKECGGYASEIKRTAVNINTTLIEALTVEELGLASQLCDDLAVLLSCPRYQFLNWLVPWRDLYRLCVSYLHDDEGTRNFITELRFVEIDYSVMNQDITEDAPIYEPYLEDYLNSVESTADNQMPQSSIPEIPLLQPYCAKSNPEVLKSLRQFRPNLKRTKGMPLENQPPEKVYLPSSSATSSSSSVPENVSTGNFFTPFYYFVNDYNITKNSSRVSNKKTNLRTSRSSNVSKKSKPNNSLDIQKKENLAVPTNIVSQSEQESTKDNISEINKNVGCNNITMNVSNLDRKKRKSRKVASDILPLQGPMLQNNGNIDTHNSTNVLGLEHHCYLNDPDTVICISDTESSDSDIEIMETQTKINDDHSSSAIRTEFYRKIPFHPIKLEVKREDTQENCSVTKQNFRSDMENTDSPEITEKYIKAEDLSVGAEPSHALVQPELNNVLSHTMICDEESYILVLDSDDEDNNDVEVHSSEKRIGNNVPNLVENSTYGTNTYASNNSRKRGALTSSITRRIGRTDNSIDISNIASVYGLQAAGFLENSSDDNSYGFQMISLFENMVCEYCKVTLHYFEFKLKLVYSVATENEILSLALNCLEQHKKPTHSNSIPTRDLHVGRIVPNNEEPKQTHRIEQDKSVSECDDQPLNLVINETYLNSIENEEALNLTLAPLNLTKKRRMSREAEQLYYSKDVPDCEIVNVDEYDDSMSPQIPANSSPKNILLDTQPQLLPTEMQPTSVNGITNDLPHIQTEYVEEHNEVPIPPMLPANSCTIVVDAQSNLLPTSSISSLGEIHDNLPTVITNNGPGNPIESLDEYNDIPISPPTLPISSSFKDTQNVVLDAQSELILTPASVSLENADINRNIVDAQPISSQPGTSGASGKNMLDAKIVFSLSPTMGSFEHFYLRHYYHFSDDYNPSERSRMQLHSDSYLAARAEKKKIAKLLKEYSIRPTTVYLDRLEESISENKTSNLRSSVKRRGPIKNPDRKIKLRRSENRINEEEAEVESEQEEAEEESKQEESEEESAQEDEEKDEKSEEEEESKEQIVVPKVTAISGSNQTSPLQNTNPKILTNALNPYVILDRIAVINYGKQKQKETKSTFSSVPGLRDLQMIKPSSSSVEHIVQVVQVPGGQCATKIPVQSNMTQISPHIQRIGQPRFEKLECANLNTTTTTDSATATTPTLINILPEQTTLPVANTRARRIHTGIKPCDICSIQIPSSTNMTENQVNSIPHVIAGGEQILNQLINSDGTSTQALRTLVGATGTDQNHIVQLICKASDGKLIPVTSFTSNKVVKLSMTQTVNSQVTGNANGNEENVTKFSQTTTKIKAELMENSEILPKFQQAFGKPAYQNCVNVTECITVNDTEPDADYDLGKSNIIRSRPRNLNSSINVQPVHGGVIYARQIPVAQSINIIPPARGQILHIATSSTEELSLVKETVIQGKMTALLASALQGNKQKTLNSNELSINSEEYSQTSTHVALTACPALVQNARIVKPIIQIPSNIIRNSSQGDLSSTTLEQLREFDMVYNQVKERSDTGVITDTNLQSDSNDETQQHVSVTYLNTPQKITCAPVVVVSNYCNVQPASSPPLSITSQGSPSPCVTPAPVPIISKGPLKTKARIIRNPIPLITKTCPIPKPQQKPLEDEHTTQRIFDILAEYAEQLRNSPDLNNKPAPRRRSNPPTNPNQSSKRKKSTGSKKLEQCSSTIDIDLDDGQTIGSEDSSCGIIQLSVPDDELPPMELDEASIIPKQIILTDNVANQHHNLIITDASVGEALKVSGTAVLVPGNYIMPVSMMKGGQQIVVSGGSKILATVPARAGSNMLLFQGFLNQTHKPVLSTIKCSTVQPVVDVGQNIFTNSNQMSIDVSPTSQNITSAKITPLDAKNSALPDVNSDREVFLNIPDPFEMKKPRVNQLEQIRRVYHNNFHHKKKEAKNSFSPCVVKMYNNTNLKTESSLVLEAMVNTTETNSTVITNSSPSLTNTSTSPIISSGSTNATSVATSVITHIKDELKGLKEANPKSEIALRILNSRDFIKDTKVQVEGRVKSVLVTAGTKNGFIFPHITSAACNKLADSTSFTRLNKGICDEGKSKNEKPVIHTYGKMRNYNKVSKINNETLQTKVYTTQTLLHKDMQCKQAEVQKDLHLQKSLSEECADLGVDEPSATDLFPEADFMYDSVSQFDQSSIQIMHEASSPYQQSKNEPGECGLFCEVGPGRMGPSPDTFDYHRRLIEYNFGEMDNEPHCSTYFDAGSPGDHTLLQTSLSASEVTIPDPREENTTPPQVRDVTPPHFEYKQIFTKLSSIAKMDANITVEDSIDGSANVLEFTESTKTLNTNQSSGSCEQL